LSGFALEVIAGQHAGARFALNGDVVTIGRDAASSIVLEDVGMSRKHAQLTPTGDGWVIEDLQSKNGVRVGGELITKHTLKAGDEIRLGEAKLRFMPEIQDVSDGQELKPVQPKTADAAKSSERRNAVAVENAPGAPVPASKSGAAPKVATAAPPVAAAPKVIKKPVLPPLPENEAEAVAHLRQARERMLAEMSKIVIGQTEVIDQILVALFSRGHCLMVGVPGLAKTLMVRTLGQATDLDNKRIQFTPDLMPSDITGTQILEEDPQTRQRTFRFVRGPIFTHILLADEINRTPPKTQAALLEAMQEGRVTAGGTTYRLAQPFFVLATQNPIEQEGTYPLPEAQLDRFMFMIKVSYPKRDEEMEIYRATTGDIDISVQPVLSGEAILRLQKIVRRVPVSDHVLAYTADLVRATRPDEADSPQFVKDWLSWGAGPRAGQYLLLAAKARAVLLGRMNVSCEDVRNAAHPVLRHRMFCNFNATSEGLDSDKVIDRLLKEVKEPDEKRYK